MSIPIITPEVRKIQIFIIRDASTYGTRPGVTVGQIPTAVIFRGHKVNLQGVWGRVNKDFVLCVDMDKYETHLSFRISQALFEKIEAVRKRMAERNMGVGVDRTQVIRLLLQRGLEAVERELGNEKDCDQ